MHYKNIRQTISFISLKGGDDIFDTKTLTFAITVSNFSRWVTNLLFRIVESGSTLSNKFWLCCSVITHNFSRKKFAHISRQVEGLCISWSSLEAYRIKPSVMTKPTSIQLKKTTGATTGYNVCVANNNLRYNLRLPWRKKEEIHPHF